MALCRLLREQTVAETRYAAIGADGRAISVFLTREGGPPRLTLGSVHDAQLRSLALAQGGAFIDVAGFPEAFLRLKPGHGLTEGARIRIRTVAEAYGDKLARVEMAGVGETSREAFEFWRDGLPGFEAAQIEERRPGDAEMASLFDDLLSPRITLPRGGRLTIERTRALTAVDIDSAGRIERGSPGARARAINVAAADELARQLELRQIGGLVVLDCVAPLTREAASAVRDAMLAAHAKVSRRQLKALLASPLGLMELSVGWARTPLSEHILDAAGNITPEATAIDGLRALEREAISHPMARLTLGLPAEALGWIERGPIDFRARLAARFGARFSFAPGAKAKPEVYPTP